MSTVTLPADDAVANELVERLSTATTTSPQFGIDRPPLPSPPSVDLHEDVEAQHSRDVWSLLIALRVVNALIQSTFFQPDEFYQALEPAWSLAFGQESGAWLTWEWTHQLRSSLHPMLFAAVYYSISMLSALGFPPTLRTQLLILLPKVVNALVAAFIDFYTWRLAESIYGKNSTESGATLWLTVLSPWQWFCSTRSFSNNLETSLTAFALHLWPWSWIARPAVGEAPPEMASKMSYCFLAAGFACLLRPTNIIIWVVLSALTLPHAKATERLLFVRTGGFSGAAALSIAAMLDRLYYKAWIFPAYRFLTYNITRDLASFYGRNRADYYFTEGLPLLLTTALPFATIGILRPFLRGSPPAYTSPSTRSPPSSSPSTARLLQALAVVSLTMLCILSLISHKEVRFIYPLLPGLLVLSGQPLVQFFTPFPIPRSTIRRIILGLLLATSGLVAGYASLIHQHGVMSLPSYLRSEFADHNPTYIATGTFDSDHPLIPITVGVTMPCHSIPWRSHLVYPDIRAWALTCEPPVDVPARTPQREAYRDEADMFYADPKAWLAENMAPPPGSVEEWSASADGDVAGKRPWPKYVVFFEQLEPVVRDVLAGTPYGECWRRFNSHWHDDWRRKGDVVVWCVDDGGKVLPDEELWKPDGLAWLERLVGWREENERDRKTESRDEL